MKPPRGSCVLGFAAHSGWTAVVVIGGTRTKPRVLARERFELADESLAGSRQPYHAIEGLPLGEASARLAMLKAFTARLAARGIHTLLQTARAAGLEPAAAGILDSSGRDSRKLEAILASHALIHAADGNHFREARGAACAAERLPCTRIRRQDLTGEAARNRSQRIRRLRRCACHDRRRSLERATPPDTPGSRAPRWPAPRRRTR